MKNRRAARILALQALYELDVTRHPVGTVIAGRAEDAPLEPELEAFARTLITGVQENRKKLDNVIQQSAPEWPLEQVAIVDRNILRIAIYEWAVLKETPVKVAINEAVEIAKDFGSESASRFINGVLGTLAAKETELFAVLNK